MVRSGNLHPIYIQGRLGGDTSQSAGSVEMVASTVERLVSQHLEVGSESNLAHLAAAGDLLARRTDNVRTLCTQGLQIGWGSTAGTRRVLGWRVSKSCRPTPSSLHRAVYSLMRRASALTYLTLNRQVKRKLYKAVHGFYAGQPATGAPHTTPCDASNRRDRDTRSAK